MSSSAPSRQNRRHGFLLPLAATAAAGLVSLGVYYYLSSSSTNTTSSSGNTLSAASQRAKDKQSSRIPDPAKRNIAVVVREDNDGLEILKSLPKELPLEWVNVMVFVLESDGTSSTGKGPAGKVYRHALSMLPEKCPKELVLQLGDKKSVDPILKQIAAETVVIQGALAAEVKGVAEGGWVGGVVIVDKEKELEQEVKSWKTKKVVVKGVEEVGMEWRARVR